MSSLRSRQAVGRGLFVTITVTLAALAAYLVLLVSSPSPARATSLVDCYRNAYDGFRACLTDASAQCGRWQLWSGAGSPYGAQITRLTNGYLLGRWEWSNSAIHEVCIGYNTDIRSWVDNRGSANPAVYKVALIS